ncbi:MAG TPA: glycoside hydrolase family 38 C-terminal domain-containing protein, partial [Terriglobales bacterium]|nr:glycoside hydrolase family 38 C-terminal domain-containing protein [Terriglobales bacterium]
MKLLKRFLIAFVLQFFVLSVVTAQTGIEVLNLPKVDLSKDSVLYTIGYSHLDTEWRWDYQTTISKYIKSTLEDNFKLFEKYPHYVFNFSGANRYRMMKEYYPKEYQKLKEYAAANRWFPCGSSMEENDALVPSPESIIRQVLYGNDYFRKELGKASTEYMLPDCFGFPASLPTILAHCGIKGFSTQKLSWGLAVPLPFNIGNWIGPDSSSVTSVFNPGSYGTEVKEDLTTSPKWTKRISDLGSKAGIYCEYMYYGTGDMGGSPTEESVNWIEKSSASDKGIRICSAPADKFFNDLSEKQKSKLPTYKGELLLTNHSAGSISSEAYMKRWNRKNELIAYSAEASSVVGQYLGGISYPKNKINEAWRLVLGGQFHDILAGTCVPRAYEYSWNDELLAANQFSNVLSDAVGSVARGLDTEVKGIPLVVFNPLSIEREDVVEAQIIFSTPLKSIQVFDPKLREVPSQITRIDGNRISILFLANVPSLGFKTYDVRPSKTGCKLKTGLKISNTSLENSKYVVKVDSSGDVEIIYDKTAGRKLLSEPARLAFLHEKPQQWPAWNMDWSDRQNPPAGYVEGPASIRIVESGPARVSLEVERESLDSKFVQFIRLSAGGGADQIVFDNKIDWFTKESSLKATFPLAVSNRLATYNPGVGVVQRGNNDPKKFEVPSHEWFDLTDSAGGYGVSVLEDCKFGSDKPADNVLRLTLLYTPGVRNDYKDQAFQDVGKHQIRFALYGHKGDWREGNSNWEGARLNQPLIAFQTAAHKGFLGKSFSFLHLSNPDIAVTALKMAENSDEIIIRLQETKGVLSEDNSLVATKPITSAKEVNGQEQYLRSAIVWKGNLVFDMKPFQIKAFAIKLASPVKKLDLPECQPVQLDYNTDVISTDENRTDGSFDGSGSSLPAEMLPDTITSEEILFSLGPKKEGQKNALSCKGQTISLPQGKFNRVYFLAASTEDQTAGDFRLDGKPFKIDVPKWDGFIGQWDDRKWYGYKWQEYDFEWSDIYFTRLTPGYVRKGDVAYFTTHRHLKNGEDDPYSYAYLYKCKLDLPPGTKEIILPQNEKIKILAVTLADNENDATFPASILFDTLNFDKSDYQRFEVCAPPKISPDFFIIEKGKSTTVSIVPIETGASIRYTLDGTDPTNDSPVYSEPFSIDKPSTLKAFAFAKGKNPSPVSSADYYNAYIVKGIRYLSAYSKDYPAGGDKALIDSKRGSISNSDKAWQGYEGNDLEAVLDLGKTR